MTTDELAQIEIEMRAAYRRRKETRDAMVAAKGELDDRRADHRKACEAVDALVLQLGTGQRQQLMPGIAAANGHDSKDEGGRMKAENSVHPSCFSLPPSEDAATMHFEIYREGADPTKERRIGTQIARTPGEALKLAMKAWDGDICIGESFPHGPDCGCGEGPTYGVPRKARKPRKEAAK